LGKEFFSNVIDPSYKGLASNVIDYANLAKSLTDINGEVGLKSMLGFDPISQTAIWLN
jgi:hypothetical protein